MTRESLFKIIQDYLRLFYITILNGQQIVIIGEECECRFIRNQLRRFNNDQLVPNNNWNRQIRVGVGGGWPFRYSGIFKEILFQT